MVEKVYDLHLVHCVPVLEQLCLVAQMFRGTQ